MNSLTPLFDVNKALLECPRKERVHLWGMIRLLEEQLDASVGRSPSPTRPRGVSSADTGKAKQARRRTNAIESTKELLAKLEEQEEQERRELDLETKEAAEKQARAQAHVRAPSVELLPMPERLAALAGLRGGEEEASLVLEFFSSATERRATEEAMQKRALRCTPPAQRPILPGNRDRLRMERIVDWDSISTPCYTRGSTNPPSVLDRPMPWSAWLGFCSSVYRE